MVRGGRSALSGVGRKRRPPLGGGASQAPPLWPALSPGAGLFFELMAPTIAYTQHGGHGGRTRKNGIGFGFIDSFANYLSEWSSFHELPPHYFLHFSVSSVSSVLGLDATPCENAPFLFPLFSFLYCLC